MNAIKRNPTTLTAAVGIAAAAVLAGCSPGTDERTQPSPAASPTLSPRPAGNSPSSLDRHVEGTRVQFASGDSSVVVTIDEDNPATRDFVSMLPMTLTLEEFNGREKVADLPRELQWQGSPGSDPDDGDLIFYAPWGNIGFYYNADGIGYSDQTIRLGTYDATQAELAHFEGKVTTVDLVD